jgi:hypothetical protein
MVLRNESIENSIKKIFHKETFQLMHFFRSFRRTKKWMNEWNNLINERMNE